MRHLNLYRALREVVREGSIRKASEKLAISASALNRQILAMEEELGVPFFERLAGGVRLSTAGEIYFSQFNRHLAEIDRAGETVSDLSGVRVGHVRVAVSRPLERGLLPDAVRNFRADHPRVSFTLTPVAPGEFSELLLGDDADLALIAQPQYHDGVETLTFEEMPVFAVVARAAAQGRRALSHADLIDMDLILPPGQAGLRAHFDLTFKRLRSPLSPVVESAQLLPPWPGGDRIRPSAQLCLAPVISRSWLTAHDACVLPLPRFAPARVVLCKRAGRVLPVAAEKFAMQLAAELQTGGGVGDCADQDEPIS
ncbi:LysR family transcriptional regulator [Actibacterium sp. D379-3]